MSALRLLRSDRGPTLREAFEQHLEKQVTKSSSPATLRQYKRALEIWETFCRGGSLESRRKSTLSEGDNCTSIVTTRALPDSGGTYSDDPAAVDDAVAASFAEWMEDQKLAASYANTVWHRLRAIFRRLAPRYPGNPQGLGLIEQVPYMAPLQTEAPKKRIAQLKELDAVYEACHAARWPQRCGVPAAWAWQGLLVLLTNHGPRTEDATRMLWTAVEWQPASPDPESVAEHPYGWLSFTPAKTRRHKPQPIVLPMHATTRAHLSRLRSLRDRVFPFGSSHHSFYRQWANILEAAQVSPFDLKDLRKTCNTAYNRIKPGLGKWVLGHAPRGVNETFYQGAIDRELIDAVAQLPQPSAFLRLLDEPPTRQQWLFKE